MALIDAAAGTFVAANDATAGPFAKAADCNLPNSKLARRDLGQNGSASPSGRGTLKALIVMEIKV